MTTFFPLSDRARRTHDQPISELMQIALERPELISLAAGFVDFETLPAEASRSILNDVLADPARAKQALQYGTTRGLPTLREAIFDHLAALDGMTPAVFPGSAASVVLTTGSQQSLHILADLLLNPGDIVLTGWPSYFVFTGALETFGATLRAVDTDEQGMRPEALDAALQELVEAGELARVKMVYTVPYFQNPTGISLADERKPMLLEAVKKHSTQQRILLIEDAAYRELGEGEACAPSMLQHDPGMEHVAYLGTFSKPFAPGLKTGYGLLPQDLVEPAVLNKGGRDFGSPNLMQHLLAEAIQRGDYAQHVSALREAYALKRHAMLEALDDVFCDMPDVHWTKPQGGLYVWLTLPGHVDTSKAGPLFEAAIQEGVLYVPGVYCYPGDATRTPPKNTIRLSFGVASAEAIGEGVRRLARAVHKIA